MRHSILIPGLLLITLSAAGCGGQKSKAKPQAKSRTSGAAKAAPTTAVATGRAFSETITLPGATVSGFETTQIRAKVGGYVKRIGKVDDGFIDIGSVVTANMVLAELDIPETRDTLNEKLAMVEQTKSAVLQASAKVAEAEAEVLQRRAELEKVKAERAEKEAVLALNRKKLERLTGLATSGAIGAEALDEVRFSVDAAKASLRSMTANEKAAETNIAASVAKVRRAEADRGAAEAEVRVAEAAINRVKTMMKYATISSPFDGVVTKRLVDHGSFVQPAENNSGAMPLFEVTRIDKVRVMASVPNHELNRIESGRKARFHTIGGLPGRSFEATITRMSATLDARSRTMQIEVDFANPVTDISSGKKIELRPGSFGTLTVVRREWTDEQPLAIVPAAAVATDDQGRDYVVIVSEGEKAKTLVDIAFNDAINVGIASGVAVGDKVALVGLAEFK